MDDRYYVKIIHICAEETPNVEYGLLQKKLGETPTNEVLVEGILSYDEYVKRKNTWDKIRQHIGLGGKFWDGGESLLYPPAWLDRAERLALFLKGKIRIPRGMGVDPGGGRANTAIALVDELGLIKLEGRKTRNTTVAVDMIIDYIHRYNVPPERVLIDRGGGGDVHADNLRKAGYNVRTVGFGDKPAMFPQRHKTQFNQKVQSVERRQLFVNRRAEMYYSLRVLLDPGDDERDYTSDRAWSEVAAERERIIGDIRGFTIPHEYHELRRQMAPIPLLTDSENKIRMLPKQKKDHKSKEITLMDLIGHSPDELDALVLAVHAMQMSTYRATAGAI